MKIKYMNTVGFIIQENIMNEKGKKNNMDEKRI